MNQKKNNNNLTFFDNNFIKKLTEYNTDYCEGKPSISDSEYEVNLLNAMNTLCLSRDSIEDYFLQNSKKKNINYFSHPSKIFKINKVYEYKSACNFFKKNIELSTELTLEYKIDGIMINIIYVSGCLYKVLTRGDKFGGEDITNVFDNINIIPKVILHKDLLEIHGELYISKKNYKLFHSSFSSSRAALMSVLKTINNTDYSTLSFVAHDIGSIIKKHLKISQKETYEFITSLNFNTVPFLMSSIYTLDKDYKSSLAEAKLSDFPVDGCIVKINSYNLQLTLNKYKDVSGSVIAIKETTSYLTVVEKIEYSMGKSGQIIPLAIIKPIFSEGITCSRISLYSVKFLSKSEIGIGSMVNILFHGIFVIDRVVDNRLRTNIEKCPFCQVDLYSEGLNSFCINSSCKERIVCNIASFVDYIGFVGFSKKTIGSLVQHNIIKNIVDFFNLDIILSNSEKIRGLADKKITLVSKSLRSLRNSIRDSDLIFSLGIQGFGINTCVNIEELLADFENVNWVSNSQLNILQKKSIVKFLSISENIKIVKFLKTLSRKNK